MEIMLDSGAYSLYVQRFQSKVVDKERYKYADYSYADSKEFINYLDRYIDFIHSYLERLYSYVTLDVIGNPQKTWEIFEYMRSHALNPIPVYHHGEDFSWFKKFCDTTDYVGLGGAAKDVPANIWINETGDKVFNYLCGDGNHEPPIKIHGFAVTSNKLLFRYPWFSVDSTSWVQYGKYGMILIPKRNKYTLNPDYTIPPHKIFVTARSPKAIIPGGYHIATFDERARDYVLGYINSKGYNLGDTEIKKVPLDYKKQDNERWVTYDGKADHREVEITLSPGLSNDHEMRDQFNAEYFLELGDQLEKWPWVFENKNCSLNLFSEMIQSNIEKKKQRKQPMRIFLAGNFNNFVYPEVEKRLKTKVEKTHEYRRLVSFFFHRNDMVRELINREDPMSVLNLWEA